jgi:hypothetical protein
VLRASAARPLTANSERIRQQCRRSAGILAFMGNGGCGVTKTRGLVEAARRNGNGDGNQRARTRVVSRSGVGGLKIRGARNCDVTTTPFRAGCLDRAAHIRLMIFHPANREQSAADGPRGPFAASFRCLLRLGRVFKACHCEKPRSARRRSNPAGSRRRSEIHVPVAGAPEGKPEFIAPADEIGECVVLAVVKDAANVFGACVNRSPLVRRDRRSNNSPHRRSAGVLSSAAESRSRKTWARGSVRTMDAGQAVVMGPSSASRTAGAFRASGTQEIQFCAAISSEHVTVSARSGTVFRSGK